MAPPSSNPAVPAPRAPGPLAVSARPGAPAVTDIWSGLRERGRKAMGLAEYVRKEVVGQDEAVLPICEVVWAVESGVDDRGHRPKGNFMCFGPTGTGKTQTPREICHYLFDGEPAILSLNEFGEANSSGQFKDALDTKMEAKDHCGKWLVLDEVEKASRDVKDVLLSVLDEGRMLLPGGRYRSFRDTYITLTSNIGSERLYEMGSDAESIQAMREFVFKQAALQLRPEFFARADEQVFYLPLSDEVQRLIVEKHVKEFFAYLAPHIHGEGVHITPEAMLAICGLGFQDQKDGARGVRKIVKRMLTKAVMRATADQVPTKPPLELHRLVLSGKQPVGVEIRSRLANFARLPHAAFP